MKKRSNYKANEPKNTKRISAAVSEEMFRDFIELSKKHDRNLSSMLRILVADALKN